MVDAFRAAGAPLWTAYYRRALPRFLMVRELLTSGAIGSVTSVHVSVFQPLASRDEAAAWRFDPAVAGAGLFLDLASHCVDLLDFLVGPVTKASGFPINTGRAYDAEDVTAAAFELTARRRGPACGISTPDASQMGSRSSDRRASCGRRSSRTPMSW